MNPCRYWKILVFPPTAPPFSMFKKFLRKIIKNVIDNHYQLEYNAKGNDNQYHIKREKIYIKKRKRGAYDAVDDVKFR